MKAFRNVAVVSLLVVVQNLPAADSKGIKVKATNVREQRVKDLTKKPAKKKSGGFGSFSFGSSMMHPPELVVTLELTGGPAADATQYGKIRVKSAKDDKGTAIRSKKDDYQYSEMLKGFVSINRQMMFMGQSDKVKDKLRVDLKFEPARRSATKIALLEGSLKLRVGKPKEVIISGVRQKAGQTIQDATLEKAGLTLKIVKAKTGGFFASDPKKSVSIELAGNTDLVMDIELIDTSGKSLSNSSSSSGGGKKISRTLMSMEDLPPNTAVKIVLALGMEEVEVPFKLEDLPLP